jgi:hypothetical protein
MLSPVIGSQQCPLPLMLLLAFCLLTASSWQQLLMMVTDSPLPLTAFAGPRSKASRQTQYKTLFPTVPLLLSSYLLLLEYVYRAITMQRTISSGSLVSSHIASP